MIGLQSKVDLVKGWAQQMRTANGYLTDAGAVVVTEPVGDNGADNTLLTGVYLADLTPLKTTPQRRDWQFDITVESRVPVTSQTTEARMQATLEDLARCIPSKTIDPADNLATLELVGAAISRQPDGIPYIVVSVTVRGTCYEFLSPPA